MHGPLLLARAAASGEGGATHDVTQLPVALRSAAFLEAADCFTAMIANAEVPSWPRILGWPCRLAAPSLPQCRANQQRPCGIIAVFVSSGVA